MEEMWKDCYGWESFYEVSNLGNIRSKKRPVPTQFGITTRGGVSIKKIVAKNGYECVNLTGGGKRRQELVHRLVLLSFIGEPEKGHQACHNDGVRDNNKLRNLRWDSISGNHADKKKHGTWQIGEKNPHAKLTNQQVREIKNSKEPLKVLAKKYGVSVGCIDKVRYKQSWANI